MKSIEHVVIVAVLILMIGIIASAIITLRGLVYENEQRIVQIEQVMEESDEDHD